MRIGDFDKRKTKKRIKESLEKREAKEDGRQYSSTQKDLDIAPLRNGYNMSPDMWIGTPSCCRNWPRKRQIGIKNTQRQTTLVCGLVEIRLLYSEKDTYRECRRRYQEKRAQRYCFKKRRNCHRSYYYLYMRRQIRNLHKVQWRTRRSGQMWRKIWMTLRKKRMIPARGPQTKWICG